MRICLVVIDHNGDEYLEEMLRNAARFNPFADLVWYDTGHAGPRQAPVPRLECSRPLKYAKITPAFFDIFEWAHQQDYDYVVNVETDLSFVTDGFADLVADAMRDADYMVAKLVPTISPTSRWRPYRSLRPELSELREILDVQTFSGGFSPAQVFSSCYVRAVVESPFHCRLRRFVEQNQSPVRSFTLQEVLLPTLACVLRLRIRDYCPKVVRFNRYRPYHSAASVSTARSSGVPFVHPVRRDPQMLRGSSFALSTPTPSTGRAPNSTCSDSRRRKRVQRVAIQYSHAVLCAVRGWRRRSPT